MEAFHLKVALHSYSYSHLSNRKRYTQTGHFAIKFWLHDFSYILHISAIDSLLGALVLSTKSNKYTVKGKDLQSII